MFVDNPSLIGLINEYTKCTTLTRDMIMTVLEYIGENELNAQLGDYHFHNNDCEEAVKYYKLGVKMNDPYSQYRLGNCYFHGDGVTVDGNKAIKYYRLGVAKGYSNAQYMLGCCYYSGFGVHEDRKKAVE